jgi:RimJ/RimL family protein N-acetyltransferase
MTPNNFKTENLSFRAFEPDDCSAIQAYLNAPGLTGRRYVPWGFPQDLPLSRTQVGNILKKWSEKEKGFHLAICRAEDDQVIGHINASWGWDSHCPNTSLVIAESHQRRGYGREVGSFLIRYFFEQTAAHNIEVGMASWNQSALQFALKMGFSEIGAMRRTGVRDGQYYEWLGLDILRTEWQTQKGGA